MRSNQSGAAGAEFRAVRWRKSRLSNPNGNCVELALLDGDGVAIRNSRYPNGPALVYTRAEMAAFLLGVKDGDFDDLTCAEPGGC